LTIYWDNKYVDTEQAFDTTRKSELVADLIIKSHEETGIALVAPKIEFLSTAEALIERLHHEDYFRALRTGAPASLASSNGFQWDEGIWDMAVHSTAGILNAIHDTEKRPFGSVNGSLSSGLHHADPRQGMGFCTVNGLAIGAYYAHTEGHAKKRVLILDFDAHCGGGTMSFITEVGMHWVDQIDLSTNAFDAYVATGNHELVIHRGDEDSYLQEAWSLLDGIKWDDYDLVLYNAGIDPHPRISVNGLAQRDELVFNRIFQETLPCVFVLAGGYTSSYGTMEEVADTHFNTVLASERILDLIRPFASSHSI
jgi:acetoin utilization deacetylase AcuC-like enzyme